VSRFATYRQQKHAEVKAFPIKFRPVEPGVYESVGVADGEVGPRAGEYRIHKTEHSGRGVSHSGRVRWHVNHVPTGTTISHRFSASYSLSLDHAIETLHIVIGRGLRDGFEVLARMNADAERKLESARREQVAREALEAKIRAAVDAWRNHEHFSDSHETLVEMVANAVQA